MLLLNRDLSCKSNPAPARRASSTRGMPAQGWALVLVALAPAAGLAPHREPPGRHLPQHGACRRTTHLVAQERPTHRWSLSLEHQLQRYQAALEASPMRTQMVTAALLAGVGDAFAQRIEARGAFAWRRFASLIFVNVVYIVPLLCKPHRARTPDLQTPGRSATRTFEPHLVQASCTLPTTSWSVSAPPSTARSRAPAPCLRSTSCSMHPYASWAFTMPSACRRCSSAPSPSLGVPSLGGPACGGPPTRRCAPSFGRRSSRTGRCGCRSA